MGETSRWMTVLLASATLCVASGCVGEQAGEDAGGGRDRSVGNVATDTVTAVEYQVFDSVIHSHDPRKVEFRLLALRAASRPSLVKTLRLALDSIGRSDSALVAARGVLYLYDSTTQRRGNVVPRLWGEWVPDAGWDSATVVSRREPHVIYTYDVPASVASPARTE